MISLVDRAMFFKKMDIYSSIRTEELLRIAELGREVAFKAGETIYREGDVVDAIYIVAEGRVELRRGGKAIRTFIKGAGFGALDLFAGVPRLGTAVAVTDIIVLRHSSLDFMDFLHENPEISVAIMKRLALEIIENIQ